MIKTGIYLICAVMIAFALSFLADSAVEGETFLAVLSSAVVAMAVVVIAVSSK